LHVSAQSQITNHQSQIASWESHWAPYDDSIYGPALEALRAEDVVLDIGAGDLRFAVTAAARARRVIAIEQQTGLIGAGPWPTNLEIVIADALAWPFPTGVTVGVLLMRHCTHFRDYARRLRAIGATRLITNARWGMGVEVVDLLAARVDFGRLTAGWYACDCGAVGFAAGTPDAITQESLERAAAVARCPACGWRP